MMKRRGLGTLVLLTGIASLMPISAMSADNAVRTQLATELEEMKAKSEMQQTSIDTLRTYRYKECVDEETFLKVYAGFNARGVANPSLLSKAIESELDKGISVTMGTAAALKLFAYDLAEKRGALADGAGFGAPIRFYDGNITVVKDTCRPRTYRGNSIAEDPQTGTLGNHIFSITPTIYFSKTVEANDLAVQPALVLSFWKDILHVGAGFNLSGQNQGNAFLLFGIGTMLPAETKGLSFK